MSKVIYYTSPLGDNPVSDFLDSIDEKYQTKILRVISNIKLYGLSSAIPHIKKLAGAPLWEIRVLGKDSIRVIFAIFQNDQSGIAIARIC